LAKAVSWRARRNNEKAWPGSHEGEIGSGIPAGKNMNPLVHVSQAPRANAPKVARSRPSPAQTIDEPQAACHSRYQHIKPFCGGSQAGPLAATTKADPRGVFRLAAVNARQA